MDYTKTMLTFKTIFLENKSEINVSPDIELGDMLQKLLNKHNLIIYDIERIVLCKDNDQLFSFGDSDHPYSTRISDIELKGDEYILIIPSNKEDRNNTFINNYISYERFKEDEKLAKEMQQEIYYGNNNEPSAYVPLPFYFSRSNRHPIFPIPLVNTLAGGSSAVDASEGAGGSSAVGAPAVGASAGGSSSEVGASAGGSSSAVSALSEAINASERSSFGGIFNELFSNNSEININIISSEDNEDEEDENEENNDGTGGGGEGLSFPMPNLAERGSRYSHIIDTLFSISGIGGAPPPRGPLPQSVSTPHVVNVFHTLMRNHGGIPANFAEPVKVTLTEDEFNSLESVLYGNIKDESKSQSCAICMCDYEDDEYVLKLTSCEHLFHKECIGKWLKESSTKCPVCKAVVAEGKPRL